MQVDVHHYRRVKGRLGILHLGTIRANGLQDKIQARGGRTVVDLWTDDDQWLGSAEAVCSEADNYNKAIGRMIATGRALKKLRQKEVDYRA